MDSTFAQTRSGRCLGLEGNMDPKDGIYENP